jgi:hypothetical protein
MMITGLRGNAAMAFSTWQLAFSQGAEVLE